MSAAVLAVQQPERNYLKIDLDFFEAVLAHPSKEVSCIALCVYRESVGWNNPEAQLSYTKLQKKTGIKRRPALAAALKEAIIAGFIRISSRGGKRKEISYAVSEEWRTSSPVEPVGPLTSSPVEPVGPLTSSPVEPVLHKTAATSSPDEPELVHQMNQNQFTSRTRTSSSGELVAGRRAAPHQAPAKPIDTSIDIFIDNSIDNGVVEIEKEKEEEEDALPPCAPEWQTVLDKIKEEVTHPTFLSWFATTRAHKEGDQFIIDVDNSFQRQHLNTKYGRLIRSLLEPLLPASMDIFILEKKARSAS